jgi:hypothetical protein
VALLLSVNVLVILYNLFLQDQRRFSVDAARLSGLQAILVFSEHLEADLRQIAMPVPVGKDQSWTWNNPVVIDDPPDLAGKRRSRLSFLVGRDRGGSAGSGVGTSIVTWGRDPRSGCLARNGSPLQGFPVEDIQFDNLGFSPDVQAMRAAMQLPGTPRPFDMDFKIQVLKVQVTAVPESARDEPAELRAAKRLTMVLTYPLVYRSERAEMPNWNYGPAEVVHPPE